MNLQAEPVAGAVKKSDVLAFADFGRIAALLEKRLDSFVNFHSVDPGSDFAKRELLPLFHRFPKFALRIVRSSADNSPRHIAPVAGLGVARKNIENDQRVRGKRTEAALVRIAGLIAAGDDCVRRRAAGAQHRGIDFGAQHFGGERFARPAQFPSGRFRRLQNFHRAGQTRFGKAQRATN